jgi:outer membrane protein
LNHYIAIEEKFIMLDRIAKTCFIAGSIILYSSPSRAQLKPPTNISTRSSLLLAARQTSAKTVQLQLSDVIKLVLQGNRDLKNATLDRIVQRQELKEAEGKFSPQITPSLSIDVAQSLSNNGSFNSDSGISTLSENGMSNRNPSPSSLGTNSGNVVNSGTPDGKSSPNTKGQNIQVSASLLTRIGTQLTLTASPFPSQKLDLSITQPLLRGAGTMVNEASVKNARFTEKQNVLTLQQNVIDKLTETIAAYRTLIKAQETVRIQSLALDSKQRQLEFTRILVGAGRKAKVELVEVQKSLADTEQSFGSAQNSFAQANSDLLRLIESDQPLKITIPQPDINALDNTQLPKVLRSPEDLMKLAFQKRLDYQQAQIAIDTEKLNQRLAGNNQLWSFDLQSNVSLGENSQASAGLVLKKTFGDRSLETEVLRRRIGVLKNENRLVQLTDNIRREVTDRLRDIDSSLEQVKTAQQAREFADQQLKISQERFRRRSGQTTLFEIIQKQDALVAAQNNELNTKIDYLNAITNLEKTAGITLDTWKDLIAVNQSLVQ